jgi:ABC-2 type transport system ATP-binding protein
MFTPEIAVPSSEPIIAVQHLAKRFGARIAIEQLAVTLHTGQIFGLIGTNGGGKTTSLRMLAGLLKPDAGSGTVLGFDVLRAGADIRQRIGYMSQAFSLYPSLSVLENLRFRAEVFSVAQPRQAAAHMLHNFGLERFCDVHAQHLSGGWLRLLQLAATLIHQPRLVLLDEPTAGLDAAHRQSVWLRIMTIANNGAGVVLNTHDLAEAQRCTQVALLSTGSVRAIGTTQAVIDATHAIALLASGDSVLPLAAQLAQQASVIASYPQGSSLRIVVKPEALASVIQLVAQQGCQYMETPLTFEDAALACSNAGAAA